ncbi:VanZ like family protein [Microbacterium sp. ru370.1]|uniref:VanZ family protein n=1 Tax=unclassified Microbacterium TaxID=2609290 RepID=UPI000883EAAB|nr:MULTISPECIES: VanZ family protein [unclassified Microbacterium]SDP03466.1 VanZ like family protein [Microbacterium sp. ru370.1]SIT91646.1 VanZ like family protein [Microbacterium sp. RU1D]
MVGPRRRRALLVAASCVYAAAVWWMTLRPSIYDERTGGILRRVLHALAGWPGTAWVSFDVLEFAANVIMFLPLGVLFVAWRRPWWQGIAAGVVVSASIETVQLLFLPTRVADVRDVVANTLGAAIGVAAALRVSRWIDRSQESHNRRHRKLIDTSAQ